MVLTESNFEKLTSGKTVFIKLFSPSCAHCKNIAKAWEKMAAGWVSHEQGLVGEIDCTVEEKFCASFGIDGLPTLLYGEPSLKGLYLEEYLPSDKTYEALSQFANEKLSKPMCSPGNLNPCDSETRQQIEMYIKMSSDELDDAIKQKEQAIKDAEKEFKAAFDEMQKAYDKLGADKQMLEASVKGRVKMIKAVQEFRTA